MNKALTFKRPLSFHAKTNGIINGITSPFGATHFFYESVCLQNDFNEVYQNLSQILDDADKLEDISLKFAEETKNLWSIWKHSSNQCYNLKILVEQKNKETIELQTCLTKAMQMMNDEKEKRKQCEQELDEYKSALSKLMKQVLRENQSNPNGDTKKLLDTFYPNRNSLNESFIENKFTSSISSTDSSYIRFEEELDGSKYLKTGKTWKMFQNNSIVLTSTKLEFQNSDRNKKGISPTTKIIQDNENQHYFQQKNVILPEICFACEKKIKFGKSALRCKGCKAIYHADCKNMITPLCLNTENLLNVIKKPESISYYAPLETPMIPNILITCIKEVEKRGLGEEGIYRVSGCEKDIKDLKKNLLSSVGTVDTDTIDIHVVTGCLKDFLLSLSEPLITISFCNNLIRCLKQEQQLTSTSVYTILSDLPQPNRDSTAYIILHLQKVVNSAECKMSAENVAKIFAPTFLGYNTNSIMDEKLFEEMEYVKMVMLELIKLPYTFWDSFLTVKQKIKVMKISKIEDEVVGQF